MSEGGGVPKAVFTLTLTDPPSHTYPVPVFGMTLMEDIAMCCSSGRVALIDIAVAGPGCITYINRASDNRLAQLPARAKLISDVALNGLLCKVRRVSVHSG